MPAPSQDNRNGTGKGFYGNQRRFQNGNGRSMPKLNDESLLSVDSTSLARLFDDIVERNDIDEKMGFPKFEVGPKKVGWLIEMQETLLPSDDVVDGLAAVDFYFLDDDGGSFKASLKYDPYFYLAYREGNEAELEEYLRRFLEGPLKKIDHVKKEDLSMPNHLVGRKRSLLKLRFHNINGLLNARRRLTLIINANKKKKETADSYDVLDFNNERPREIQESMEEIYEYDVPYHVRVSIDNDIRVGKWYTVESDQGNIQITVIPERELRADPVVLAYDIETTKAPLKFPDASVDKVMMISYMIDGAGYLITNREIVSQDIDDFEYTPKPEYHGEFTIFNEATEKDLLIRFFDHIKEEKPTVIATFNGDFFDWPFVETRAKHHGIDMYQEIGFKANSEGEYNSMYCAHLDCYRWVKRDSYLPQGSQGLKAVTTAKLGYNPIEIDPELMTPYAMERPQIMAEYSVSDAVATYYLYMKYVHPFIFSLCTILPLNPDEVLRKGTGTLCEMLLMVQAYQNNILIPHKHKDPTERFYNGHLIESETYVGGHVESLEAGVFRSDLPASFNIDTTAVDQLLHDLDSALKFSIEIEGKSKLEDVTNYDEVKDQIAAALMDLKSNPTRKECPSIYHVDVASMYPNIMTTNRLQPDAMVSEQDCASCDFNRPDKVCDRRLPWAWRGEFLPANSGEYLMIKNSFAQEKFPDFRGKLTRNWNELDPEEQSRLIKKRLADYSKKIYHRAKITETVEREAIICQKENPFYVNTVRDFRDRRYEFKGLQKVWKRKVDSIPSDDADAIDEAKKMVVLYDSLQLAHKVILNSFYGYVMRKGSRWYSVEMAGVTCLTGATIIQMARALVERIGRPLELDTDGIWCILPKSFPEDFVFKFKNGKTLTMSYPCGMLNHLVHERFTNHQYQTLTDPETFTYETSSDNSIFFEVDGPYKAMMLPTSKEEGKGLKKRYAVFNDDGSLAELKGFEIKRRGELRLIKAFQSQIFAVFLQGSTLSECYAAVAGVANSWLDILDSKGVNLENEDLMDLISENRSMSKTLDQYDGQKSTSICTARRLAEFLGPQMVKDAGLACKYIISSKPHGAPVTDRAVPVAIFSADLPVKRHYLRKWLKDPGLDDFDPRVIIDWAYYRERLASTVQKIITIPAALQGVSNPVPRIPHPDWLAKKVTAKINGVKQQSLSSYFSKATDDQKALLANQRSAVTETDIEDIGSNGASTFASANKVGRVTVSKRKNGQGNSRIVEDIPTLPSTVPSTDNYAEWLKYHKIKWRIQELARKRRRQLFGETRGATAMGSLEGAFRDQNETAFSSTWRILQYLPSSSDAPGETRVFALINDKIQSVRIRIPRRFYLNFKPNEEVPDVTLTNAIVEQSKNSLPNGHVSGKLFLVTMPEEDYQKELSRSNSILHHQFLEGIYESHISSTDRALLNMGAACSLIDTMPGLLGKGLEGGFNEEWLQPVEPTKSSDLKANFVYIHLIHIVYHDYEIFALLNTWTSSASVYILRSRQAARSSSSDADFLPNLTRFYQQQLQRHKEVAGDNLDSQSIDFMEAVEFEQLFFDSPARLYQRLSASLSKMHSEKSTKAILCLQTPQASRLKKLVRNISEFPTIEVRAPSNPLPAIGWQAACSKRIVKCFLGLGPWISHLHGLSCYSNIPIGNLMCDDVNFLIDVAYARKLQSSGIILWWSRSPIPDEGGIEKDSILPFMDPIDLPEVNNSGLYSKVCIDIKIRNLSVNTICTAALLNEKEGVDLASLFVKGVETSNASLPFLENAFSSSAMSILSSLVRDWWSQAVNGNEVSDSIVNSFVSWVSSSSSLLYDHTLYYHVQNLSKKAFIQLIGEFRRAGSELVYADEHRFLVCTNKNVVENTYSYASYLVKVLRGKPLFHFLDISVSEYWDTLLWMDKTNYGGRSCKEVSDPVKLSLTANWNLKNFLPVVLQEEFDTWVYEFMTLICKHRDDQRAANGLFGQYREERNGAASEGQASEDSYFGKGILKSLEKPLSRRVLQLMRRYIDGAGNPDVAIEFEIPQMAGSYPSPGNPILQFVKLISAVFNISEDMVFESQLIRRHMLEVLGVKEFSTEAIFKDPCRTLKMSKIICDSCNYIRDIDLCRDESLIHVTNGHYAWLCEECGREYNRLVIEERLIQSIEHMVTKFQVQDLKCEKCKKIKDDFLSSYCDCSGRWAPTVSHHETVQTLNTYKQVSSFYNFRIVEQVLEEIHI